LSILIIIGSLTFNSNNINRFITKIIYCTTVTTAMSDALVTDNTQYFWP